jgi:hypothetical protein
VAHRGRRQRPELPERIVAGQWVDFYRGPAARGSAVAAAYELAPRIRRTRRGHVTFPVQRVLEAARATGDELLEHLIALAVVLTYRAGRWGPWTGTLPQLRAEVHRILRDRWARVWARLAGAPVSIYASREREPGDIRRTSERWHVKNQAAAVAVWVWRHGYGDLAGHEPLAVARWFFQSDVDRTGGTHPAEDQAVADLLDAGAHALATWSAYYRAPFEDW